MQNNNTFVPAKRPPFNLQAGKKKKAKQGSVAKSQQARAGKLVSRIEKTNRIRVQDNPYLRTLVDPENCHGVRYPDSLPKGTAVFRGLINRNAFYFPDSTIEPVGTMFHMLSPTLINPLLEYRSESVTVPAFSLGEDFRALTGGVANPDDAVGLFPIVEDAAAVATSDDEMWIEPGQIMNMKTKWHWFDQDFTYPPFRGTRADATVFYGTPVGVSVGASVITIRVNIVRPLPSTTNPFTLTLVTTAGLCTGPTVTGNTIGSQTLLYTFSSGSAGWASLFNGGGYAGLPGIGVRIQNSYTNGYLLSSYDIAFCPIQAAVPTVMVQPRFVGISLPDEATYSETVDQYRVVSMSEWLEYDGSDLNNGGQVASILYRGGQSSAENGLYNYGSVSVAPESYAGPLKLGTYTIWAPNSDNDMLMRNLSPHNRWEFPYITNAAVVATVAQVNAIRLRIAINYEIVSTAQFYDFEKPMPLPELIQEASLVLREHPCTMANGKHWDWIKGVFKEATNLGRDVAKWGLDNSSWLVPAATAAASLI